VASPPSSWRALWPFEKLTEVETRIISVAEDAAGELYILTNDEFGPFGETGKIFKVMPSGS